MNKWDLKRILIELYHANCLMHNLIIKCYTNPNNEIPDHSYNLIIADIEQIVRNAQSLKELLCQKEK